MNTFFIVTSAHACTELIVETNQLRDYLVKNDFTEVGRREEADLILVSTCSFNQQYEDEAYRNITESRTNRKPGAQVIVSGCYPKIAPHVFKEFPDVVDIPPLNMEKIETIIAPKRTSFRDSVTNSVNDHEYLKSSTFMVGRRLKNAVTRVQKYLPFVQMPNWLDSLPMTDWYFIQGGNGCLGNCTFCAIKHARGKIKSTGLDQIMPQLERAVRRGYKTISFTGTDMGCWGQDIGSSLPDLLNEVVKVPGDFVVDMHYVEPDWLIKYIDRLEPVFQSGKIRSFGSPVQSGSNRILKLMGRNYVIEDYIRVVNHVIDNTRVKSMNSIVMVGFPRETKEDFLETYNLINKVKISYWCLLKYEGRHNIPSEKLDGKVPEEIAVNRLQRIERKAKLRNYVGLSDALVEKIVRKCYGPVR
ncbi:MAG TPA: radical SAM protein [Candidatus Ozemobacteraceae bacterium]|nr:radical SAM protein [Candidatus Ozemobacteraceae bacterium]